MLLVEQPIGSSPGFVSIPHSRRETSGPDCISEASSSTSALMAEQQPTRQEFFSQAAVLAVGAGLLTQPEPAQAAKYGGFGAGSPEVLDPSDAEVDRDVLGSGSVQSALSQVKEYQNAVRSMQAKLQADPQANVRPTIVKELDFSKLRTTLNAINPALDEDTQRGTDRLIRVIMQDITELETANAQKEGVPRSERRLDIMKGKLSKLDKAFSDYLAFAK